MAIRNKKSYVISILLALAVGGASAYTTADSMKMFSQVAQPPLSPPEWLFPIVWTILFILMGIGAALVYNSGNSGRRAALMIYGIQLALNFTWTVIFFNIRAYFGAFLCLVLLLLFIILMISAFAKADKKAAWLQIPYLLWVSFAGYLNLAIFILNR